MNRIAILTTLALATTLTTAQVTVAQTTKATSSASVSPTKAASPSAAAQDSSVKKVLDAAQMKVAELRKNQKAVAGTVLDAKNSLFQIRAQDDTQYSVKIDDSLTKLFQVIGNTKKEIKFGDVKKDSYILVTGPLMDKTINANFVYVDDQYIVKSGKITEVNKDDDYVKVISSEKDTFTLDIGSKTQVTLMDIKTLELGKATISKIKEGDTLHFVVKRTGTEKEPNRYTAEKMVIIPQEFFSAR